MKFAIIICKYFLYILLEKDSNDNLKTKLYDKRVDFNFSIINFPYYFCSDILVSPAYGAVFYTQGHALRMNNFLNEASHSQTS